MYTVTHLALALRDQSVDSCGVMALHAEKEPIEKCIGSLHTVYIRFTYPQCPFAVPSCVFALLERIPHFPSPSLLSRYGVYSNRWASLIPQELWRQLLLVQDREDPGVSEETVPVNSASASLHTPLRGTFDPDGAASLHTPWGCTSNLQCGAEFTYPLRGQVYIPSLHT